MPGRGIFHVVSYALVCAWMALAPAANAADGTESAKQFVTGIGDRAIGIINQKSVSMDKRMAQLQALFGGVVDTDWVGKFVLGKHWRTATDAQKKLYLQKYRGFLITHYTSKFSDYTTETFKINGAQPDASRGEFTVSMEIVRPKADSNVLVDYHIRSNGHGGFKVFDIVVEGVSLIATQRSEFNSVVSGNGLDFLIQQLDARTKDANEKARQGA